MIKKKIGTNMFMFLITFNLLGTMVDKKPTFKALKWVSRVNFNPPLVRIGVGR
jgi:hypothetical protein